MREKKVRGMRRHARRHRQRAAVAQALSLRHLEQAHADRQQLGLAPWTVHGKPPLALRRWWAGRLLADFFTWHQQLTSLYPTFYLAIRLYEPRFGRSQLDAAIYEQQAQFEARFGPVGADVPLPPEYQALPGASRLRWTCYAEVDIFDLEEFAEYYSWYKRKPYWADQTAEGEACMVVQTGWVWVGQLATAPAP